jgi:hypothetical protein
VVLTRSQISYLDSRFSRSCSNFERSPADISISNHPLFQKQLISCLEGYPAATLRATMGNPEKDIEKANPDQEG